jgi:hypothetical protein
MNLLVFPEMHKVIRELRKVKVNLKVILRFKLGNLKFHSKNVRF